ncbi:MAG: beta-lactamase family protein [Ruminococcaceae bacterium]|nr:beta-lactamase family protein [Oscillospiraceae bacterium]
MTDFKNSISFLDSFLEMGVPGYDCIAYYNGKEVFRHMNGYSDLETKTPVMGNEMYNIYSCSKPITCAAALQLFEKGKFELDDELSTYIPEFKDMTVRTEEGIVKAVRPIRIRNLFTMTAGFSYDLHSPGLEEARKATDGRCPTVETIKYLAKDPLIYQPGDKYQYSLAHDVIAALVEVLAEERFEDYVKKNIFDVLGMEHTTYNRDKFDDSLFASQYRFDNEKKCPVNVGKKIQGYRLGSEYDSGGAGASSTTEDYIRFLEGMRTCKILKPVTLEMMNSPQLTPKQMPTYSGEDDIMTYGLGVRTSKDKTKITEFGWGGAAASALSIDRVKGLTVFLAKHLLNSPSQSVRQQIRARLCEDLGI